MKTREIAREYGISQREFEQYLKDANVDYRPTLTGIFLDDDIPGHVQRFKEYVEEGKRKQQEEKQRIAEEEERCRQAEIEEQERRHRAEEEKQKALANMLITSGFNFDGYRIKKYSGYISGDDAISIDRGKVGFFTDVTDVGSSLTRSLAEIRRKAIQELKEAAYNLGCNAVIGVDFDYITLEPETANSSGGTTYLPYVFCVTANGNAVIIEKEE